MKAAVGCRVSNASPVAVVAADAAAGGTPRVAAAGAGEGALARRRAGGHDPAVQRRRRRLPERSIREPPAHRGLDHRVARRRRVARDHHPQHRSLGGLHRRRRRVPHRGAAGRTTRTFRPSSRSRSRSAIGAGLGLVNGVLVAVARVPSIIVTLGTLSIFRSVLTSHAGGKTIATGSLPAWLVDLPRSTVFTIGRLRGANDVRARAGHRGRCSISRCSSRAAAATSTRSAPTRTRRARPASTTGASRSPPSSPAARWRGSPASCTSAGSARSTSPPAPASSWPRSPPRSSV